MNDGALVIGGDYRALGVVRSLGRKGIPVWVLAGEHRLATASRYCRRYFEWPRQIDQQLDYLLSLCDKHGLDGWALIPSDEEAAALLGRNHATLAARFRVTSPPWETLRWGYDKRFTHQLALDLGIDEPGTFTPSSRDEAAELPCRFPVILKPAFKEELNRFTHAKAWPANNREELVAAYDEAAKLVDPAIILVQELIPGGGETQFSYAALCDSGRPLASIAACRQRQYPVDFGRASSYVFSVEDPELERLARRILSAISFSGLVEVEFKRDPRDGAYKLLDINSRIWGWHTLAQRAGVDFPHLLWRWIHGDTFPDEVRGRPGVRWVRMLTDVPAASKEIRMGRLSAAEYLRSLTGPLECAILAADDPLPAFLEAPYLLRLGFQRRRRAQAPPRPQRSRVCMITHSDYDGDFRVMRYAETLVQRGDSVDVFALRRSPSLPKKEVVGGVNLFRIQNRFHKHAKSKLAFLLPILRFLFVSSWEVTRRHRRRRYDVVHVHNIPDFLVFAAWYPKLTGARIILDVHDIVPELFTNIFKLSSESGWVRALKLMERLSARFADHVILSNHLWLEKYVARSSRADRCSVFINNVDTTIFQPRPRRPGSDKRVIIFPGSLQWHQGLDIAIRAMKKLTERISDAELHIYGDGPEKPQLMVLTKELALGENVRFFELRRVREIAEVMAQADLGIVPKRADTFGNEAFSTKILEFMAVGVPVVASSTKIDRYYFNDSLLRFFPSGDVNAMADAMYEVLSNRQLQTELVSRGTEHAALNTWATRKADYLSLVDSIRAA